MENFPTKKILKPELEVKRQTGILDSLENQILLAKKLGNVYENRPDINSFVGVMKGTNQEVNYTKEAIEKDELYVKNIRQKIDESNSSEGRQKLDYLEGGFQLSEILQAMVTDRLNKNWFKDCEAIMTSDYDDLSVGIDAVMKHKKGGYLGMTFDFTVSNQDKKIYEKLKNEWNKNTEKGNIPTIKYFEDPDTKEKRRLLVPKFIIGASKKDVEELADAYLNNNSELLDNHPFKYLILLQIEEQMQTVLDYFESIKCNEELFKKFTFANTQYERIQNILRNMKNEIHFDKNMHENIDLYEYSKNNTALDMMRRFRIMRTSNR